MQKQRYGGSITWDGAAALVLPKQPETRRLVWLAAVGAFGGDTTSLGMMLEIKDGSLDVARKYLCAAALTDSVTFETMFLFAEDVGNETVLAANAYAQATTSLGRDCYFDAASRLELSSTATPASGTIKVTYVFEDVE